MEKAFEKIMNRKVIDFLKDLPLPYADSDDAFWDDEHISKHMLAAHLNPDCENASRKQNEIVNSVNWITDVCGGTLLQIYSRHLKL